MVTPASTELHVHLEGSLEPATLLLLRPELTVKEIDEHYRFQDFSGFLRSFVWATRQLQEPEDYAIATTHLLQRLAAQGVAYAEVTLSAGVVLKRGHDLRAVYGAVRQASQQAGLSVYWILDAVRQFGAEPAQQVAEFAADHAGDGVVAFGIGGDEVGGPVDWFTDVFRFAASHGLALVPHAGETAGPESIWGALRLGARRIGHGIRAVDDPALLKVLRTEQIPLEVCMTSNVRTGAVPTLAAHPVRRLWEAGVRITLNTDDPALFQTSLTKEFALAAAQFGFSPAELAAIDQNAELARLR